MRRVRLRRRIRGTVLTGVVWFGTLLWLSWTTRWPISWPTGLVQIALFGFTGGALAYLFEHSPWLWRLNRRSGPVVILAARVSVYAVIIACVILATSTLPVAPAGPLVLLPGDIFDPWPGGSVAASFW